MCVCIFFYFLDDFCGHNLSLLHPIRLFHSVRFFFFRNFLLRKKITPNKTKTATVPAVHTIALLAKPFHATIHITTLHCSFLISCILFCFSLFLAHSHMQHAFQVLSLNLSLHLCVFEMCGIFLFRILVVIYTYYV